MRFRCTPPPWGYLRKIFQRNDLEGDLCFDAHFLVHLLCVPAVQGDVRALFALSFYFKGLVGWYVPSLFWM